MRPAGPAIAKQQPKEPILAPAPLWLRLALSAFVAFLIPYYWAHYGWRNFLWLSDVSLFVTVIALWRTSRLLISMMAVGILPLELFWNIDFFAGLLSGGEVGGLAHYMFDESLPLTLRAVSLFHVALPVIWVWLLLRWGYDRRALKAQTLLLWLTLAATYLITAADENINWVFVPQAMGWAWLPVPVWLIAYMVAVPAVIQWPLHRLYLRGVEKGVLG